jgi:hypothetical protein
MRCRNISLFVLLIKRAWWEHSLPPVLGKQDDFWKGLVVGGQWMPDPMAKETVSNSFGGTNSVLTVT